MKSVGTGTRVLNFLVDTLIIFLIGAGVGKWYNFHVMYYNYTALPPYSFFFITLAVYYFLFEAIAGRTPGKWLTISKVVNNSGKRASVVQIFVRTLVRLTVIDCFFIPFLDGLTLHDYLSRTKVIEA